MREDRLKIISYNRKNYQCGNETDLLDVVLL